MLNNTNAMTRQQSLTSKSSFNLTPIKIAFSLAMITITASAIQNAHAVEIQTQEQMREYNIDAGPLAEVINLFASASGLALTFDASTLKGLQSNGLQGKYSVTQGFAKILENKGLQATPSADGGYTLKKIPVNAPQTENAQTLPEVNVISRLEVAEFSPTSHFNGYVAKRSITGTKTDTPIVEVPQSISVIGRDELDARGAQEITEALRYTPGVVVDNYGFENRGYEYLLMRGFDGLYTSNYRDGLMQASGLYFSSFVSEQNNVERIEVLRGPTSVLFGQGDAGGIVNRVSKRPSMDARREIGVQIGSFDRKQITADVGGKVNEDGSLLFRVVAVGLDTDTQVKYSNGDRASVERTFIAPSLQWNPNEDTSITLLAEALRNRNKGGGAFYAEQPGGGFSGILQADPKFDRTEQDQYSVGYQVEHKFNRHLTFRQNFRYARTDVDVHEIYPAGLTGNILNRYAIATQEDLDQTLLDTHLQANFNTASVAHTVLAGVDINKTHATLKFFVNPSIPGLDLSNPVYGVDIAEPSILNIDAKQDNRQLGFYLQDQVRFNDHWLLTIGGRQDKITSDTISNATPTKQTDHAFSGRAGLTYLFDNGLAPYISYAESFQPQNGQDARGKSFEPTKGEQYEIGVKYQPADGKSLYTAAIFDLTKSNVPTRDLDNPGFRTLTGEIRSRGLELEAKTEILSNLDIIAAYTYNNVEVTKSNDNLGKTPIQIPKHTSSIWLDYKLSGLLSGLSVGGGVRYVGSRYDDPQNIESSPSFTLVDAAIRYNHGPWRFMLNGSNLADKQYFASRAYGGYYVGSERTINATLKYQF